MSRLLRRLWRLIRLGLHLVHGLWIARHLRGPHGEAFRHPDFPRAARAWNARLLQILGVEVDLRGRPTERPALWVANHVSWLDIPLVAHVSPVAFLSKAEIADWPLVGRLARDAGTLFIERGARDGAHRALEQIVWHLVRGRSVLIFPEATTSDGREVRRFHPRLFAAARLAHAPIQPVAIRYRTESGTPDPRVAFTGDDTAWRSLWRILALPRIRAELHFCPPVEDPDLERRHLAERARECIVTHLQGQNVSPNQVNEQSPSSS